MCKALANSGKVCYTYGRLLSRTGSSTVIFGYNGRDGVITDGNGLIYMRARYYSPDVRRFINADVVAGEISNAITLNRFAYANGNPVSMSDPFGLSAADQRGNPSSSSVGRDSSMIRYNKSVGRENGYDPDIISYIIGIGNGSFSPEDYWQQQELLKKLASIDTSGLEIDQDLVDIARADMQAYIASRNSLLPKDDPFETSKLRWKALKSAMAALGHVTVEAIEDLKAYVNNDSEQVVLNAKYFAFYKGKLVVKLPVDFVGFSVGVIFLGTDAKLDNDVKHEYGHTQQLEKYGLSTYLSHIALPSVGGYWLKKWGVLDDNTYPYYSMPYEYEADLLGGATRQYEAWAQKAHVVYSIGSRLNSFFHGEYNISTEFLN